MKINMYYRHTITDIDQRIVSKTHWKKSHSFVLQFLQVAVESFINHAYGGSVSVTVKDTSNTNRTLFISATNGALAGVGIDTYGIQLGTGVGAVSNADYKLGTPITHGVAAGNLQYGACSYTSAAVIGANVDLYFQRPFVNGSGGTVTPTEVAQIWDASAGVQAPFCISRDLSTQAILNTQTDTVQYLWRTTA